MGSRLLWRSPVVPVIASVLFYTGVMMYIVVMQYYTFHDDFLDLGVENQVMWLLSHGHIQQFLYTYHYGYELEKPILLLILPIYALFPSPYTLIVLGTVALGMVPVPLYVMTRNLTGMPWISVLVAVSSVFYFPLASANLFNFHMMTLSPVLYLTMAMYWSMGKRRYMYLFAALTAMVDSLALILVMFFLLYVIYTDVRTSWDSHGLRRALHSSLAIVVLISLLMVYGHFGLYTAGAAPRGVPLSTLLLYDFTDKLELFMYLFANTGFIPLMDPWTIWFMMPYIGFVFLSGAGDNFMVFGMMFPVLSAGPMFLGLSLALSKVHGSSVVQEYGGSWKHLVSKMGDPAARILIPLVVAMIVFALVYFPIGPLNSHITGTYGGYYNGNHDVSNLTHVDADVVFLHRVLGLIPGDGAVITQDNIPQLSGRVYYQAVVTQYNADIPYNYLLIDLPLDYFAQPSLIFPLADSDLSSGAFGILAEGHGALLLEEGYHGEPELYTPYEQEFLPQELRPTGSGYLYDGTIKNNISYAAYSMWDGPGITLLPGSYNVTFLLSSQALRYTDGPILDLVISYNGQIVGSMAVYQTSFYANQTEAFTLRISSDTIMQGVELMGLSPSVDSEIYLHAVSVVQTGA